MAHLLRAYGNIADYRRSLEAGLRLSWEIVVWLARVIMPTPEDLAEAGVYLGENHP